jgi:hypothetical protein
MMADVGIDPAHLIRALGEGLRALARAYESVTCVSAMDEPNLESALRKARPPHQ